ncbi:hypothetical protein JMJ77_0005529, partial [Colletotrichum scovillei]
MGTTGSKTNLRTVHLTACSRGRVDSLSG